MHKDVSYLITVRQVQSWISTWFAPLKRDSISTSSITFEPCMFGDATGLLPA